jgi:CRISPR-associated protein Csx17
MEERLTPYREVIKVVRSILKQERVVDKPADEIKIQLLRRYRRELPEAMLGWMDAVMVLQEAGQAFAPLLGTGGNDGRFDFTQNFMGRLIAVGMPGGKPHPQSEHWLRCALMAVPAMLKTASVGQFAPGRSGGPNATQGMEGDATDNPWDFLLMLEGTLLLAGAAVK